MSKFYLLLWVEWATRLTLSSLFYGVLSALGVTLFIYAKEGFGALDAESLEALSYIFMFWLSLLYNIALLIALFRSIKYVFNSPKNSYVMRLYSCPKDGKREMLEEIGYGDLVKTWRKWFMLLIWLVGAQMVVAVTLNALLSLSESTLAWFNIYVLYGFILVAGYFSFMILGSRCKQVRIERC